MMLVEMEICRRDRIPVTKMQRESTAKRNLAAAAILLGLSLGWFEEGEELLQKEHK